MRDLKMADGPKEIRLRHHKMSSGKGANWAVVRGREASNSATGLCGKPAFVGEEEIAGKDVTKLNEVQHRNIPHQRFMGKDLKAILRIDVRRLKDTRRQCPSSS